MLHLALAPSEHDLNGDVRRFSIAGVNIALNPSLLRASSCSLVVGDFTLNITVEQSAQLDANSGDITGGNKSLLADACSICQATRYDLYKFETCGCVSSNPPFRFFLAESKLCSSFARAALLRLPSVAHAVNFALLIHTATHITCDAMPMICAHRG